MRRNKKNEHEILSVETGPWFTELNVGKEGRNSSIYYVFFFFLYIS